MKLLPAILGVGVLVGGAYWLTRSGGPFGATSSPAAAAPPNPNPGSTGLFGRTPASVKAGLPPGAIAAAGAPLAALGPAGAIGSIVASLADLFVSTGAADATVDAIGGKADKSRAKRKAVMGAQAMLQGEADAMERYLEAAYNAVSRDDVEWWRVNQLGTLEVQYNSRAGFDDRGNPQPWRLDVSRTAANPVAWAQELSSRIFGGLVQEGRGPIKERLELYDEPGFTEANAYAPRRYQVPKLSGELLNLQQILARSQDRPAPEAFEA